MKYIIINEWQKWLSSGPRMGEYWCAPEFKKNYRSYRYGNAENVYLFTQTLANALTAANCKFYIDED